MNVHSNNKKDFLHRGFTLVELSVVLVIITLLMTGLVPTISSQIAQQKTSDTRNKLDEIRNALLGFAVINGRLPYPSCGTLPANTTYAGIEITPASAALCTSSANDIATLPWATLGVAETDAWGRRYSYRVKSTFADTTEGSSASCPTSSGISFQICSTGDIVIKESSSGSNIASNLPLVVVSHGINGCGAYLPTGSKVAIAKGNSSGTNCNNAGDDQFENSDVVANVNFVSHVPSSNFDDLVIWISSNALTSRMVTAGRLP